MVKNYLKTQLKRAGKLCPEILLVTTLTILGIAVLFGAVVLANNNSAEKQNIKIGIVGNIEDSYFSIGLYALENMDNSVYIDVVKLAEEEAVAALKNGEINGYFHIPNDFVNSVFSGENKPAEYITLNVPENFGTVLSNNFAETLSGIVTDSQLGMYSMQLVANDYNSAQIYDKIQELMTKYIGVLLERNALYQVTEIGVADQTSFAGYYICAMLIFVLMLWGISANSIFSTRNLALSRMICSRNVSSTKQILCEYLSYFVTTLTTFLLFSVVAGILLCFTDFGIQELKGANLFTPILYVLALTPAIAVITMMHTAIYELIPSKVASLVVLFAVSIALAYFSGCFYPENFFPDGVRSVAAYLPSSAAFSYARQLMSGSVSASTLLLNGTYIIVFFIVAAVKRKCRIAGDSI